MLRIVPVGKYASVDRRVERLDTAVHDLFKICQDVYTFDCHTEGFNRLVCPSGRIDFIAISDKTADERFQTAFIRNADQCFVHHSTPSITFFSALGSSSYSSLCILFSSTSSASFSEISIASWAMISPVSMPASTKCIVTPVTFTP